MKTKFIVILAIFVLSSTQMISQWSIMRSDADSLVRLGTGYIYNVEFSKAEECFRQVKDIYPEHPAGYFLDAMVEWWRITLDRSTNRHDANFERKISQVVTMCDKLLKENPSNLNGLFFKAGAIGFRGRYFAQKEEWIKAARDGSSAYNLLIECYKIAPQNHDIMLGTGIYNYFAVAVPEKYPLLKPLLAFLPRGDKLLAMHQLRAAARNARYANIEAKTVLLQIYYSFERDNDFAHAMAQELFEAYPQNAYFHRYLGRVIVRKGLTDEYEKIWREILLKCMDKKFGYDNLTAREAMYYVGLALLKKGRYDQALRYFLKSDEGNVVLDKESSGFQVNSNLYIGNIYDVTGKRDLALQYYRKVLAMKDYEDSHRKAQNYINKGYGK
ncbi:MAG: tetratricopeptide repeat protein [Candidatus Kapabacteria bacterium]|nr:tetratricopeptide repeat protein [Candidatus Kapabacteria bacterium]